MTLPSRLYLIVDPLDTGRDPVALADAMLAGGARWLQLRLKRVTTGALLAVAERVCERAARHGATLVVNDRADVAAACGAHGVHLGQDDLPIPAARALLPGGMIGFSTHSEAQLVAAASLATDYLALGPMFVTTSKATADPVIGCQRLADVRPRISRPVVAIGGITAATAPAVLAAGADAIAVIAAVVRAPDVERATADLLTVVA